MPQMDSLHHQLMLLPPVNMYTYQLSSLPYAFTNINILTNTPYKYTIQIWSPPFSIGFDLNFFIASSIKYTSVDFGKYMDSLGQVLEMLMHLKNVFL